MSRALSRWHVAHHDALSQKRKYPLNSFFFCSLETLASAFRPADSSQHASMSTVIRLFITLALRLRSTCAADTEGVGYL